MIYLDTHVVVWLYAGELQRIPAKVRDLIEENELQISPIVQLELQCLKEIERISSEPALMIENLAGKIGLSFSPIPFIQVVAESVEQNWTRDPFDRIITATAAINSRPLVTKDQAILENYPHATWE